MTQPEQKDPWRSKYPKVTSLFRAYLVDQPVEVWEEQVHLYKQHGEKLLEFKGIAAELDTLSRDEVECARFLHDVLGIDQAPIDAYRTICNTYNQLNGIGDPVAGSSGRGLVKVRNGPEWIPRPDDDEDDDTPTVTSKQLWKMQMRAKIPVLPGRWADVPIVNYLTVLAVALLIGVLITLLLPFPVVSQLGSVLILLALIGIAACALLMVSFRNLLLYDDPDDENANDEDAAESEGKKKPGRIRALFTRRRR